MVKKVRQVSDYVTVTCTDKEIEYYSRRNDARMSFSQQNKYKMVEVIQVILDKNNWNDSIHHTGKISDTGRFGYAHIPLLEAGLGNVYYFGNNWYEQDLKDVLRDLKLSLIPTDILKNKNVDKLKEILKGMSLKELIYLHESGIINE